MGAAQVGLGIYGRYGLDGGPAVRRTAVGQFVVGAIGLGGAIVGFARPSGLERLRESPSYRALLDDPSDDAAFDRLMQDWEREERRARRWRFVWGGGHVAVGLAVTAIASVRLFPEASTQRESESLWAVMFLGTGLGLLASGFYSVASPGELERARDLYDAIDTTHRPRRRTGARLRVSPTLGGLVLHGKF